MGNLQSLMIAIVQHADVETAMRALLQVGLRVTLISSMGGFLREGNVTLLLGLARQEVSMASRILSLYCKQRTAYVNAEPYAPAVGMTHFLTPIEILIGGATVFVLPVEQYIRINAHRRTRIHEPQERGKSDMEMKLVLAIVPEEQANGIMDVLVTAHYSATLISTTGGLLRKGNATLLIGVQANKTEDVLQRIEQFCVDALAKTNVADPSTNIFVLNVEQFASIGPEAVVTNAASKPVQANP